MVLSGTDFSAFNAFARRKSELLKIWVSSALQKKSEYLIWIFIDLGSMYNFSGQFKRLIKEGPSCIIWPLQSVVGRLSLRVQQLDVLCETKTKDNVFVQVGVAVQYRVVTESAYDAWYRLTSPTR